ncbi:MAG: cytochrome c peroxidase [Alphaproteobacteria bacterium]
MTVAMNGFSLNIGVSLSLLIGVGFFANLGISPVKADDAPGQVNEVIILKAAYKRPTAVPFPEDNPFTEAKAKLGQMLYFDPRLSRSNMQSCASCHNPSFAWGDGLPKGVGDHMNELGRRSPTILNAAWSEALMWDGRFETLEEQALGPIQAGVEMNMPLDELLEKLNNIDGYRPLFAAAFDGDEEITAEKIAMAIATYERTVISGEAPFDRWIKGQRKAISASAQRGFQLFNGKARCSSCHVGWRFSDDSFHDIGLADDDVGRGAELSGIVKMQHAFKTPGLRNIDQRAPYMHDGSLATLADVVEHYDHGGIKRPSLSDEMHPLGLTEQEKKDLVTFMKSLTSDDDPVTYVQLPR